jgi:UDP-glucuronate decarboxylase
VYVSFNEGHDVICLDNYFTGDKKNILHLMDNSFRIGSSRYYGAFYAEVDEIYNLACPATGALPIQSYKND